MKAYVCTDSTYSMHIAHVDMGVGEIDLPLCAPEYPFCFPLKLP